MADASLSLNTTLKPKHIAHKEPYLKMSMRKLLKLKRELDILEIDIQLWGLKYHSLLVNKKTEVGQPVDTNDVGENLEGDKVNFYLPSRFEADKEQQDEHDEGTCESFIILDSPQKFQLEKVGRSLFPNGACHENQEVDWNLPPKCDEQKELQVL